MEKVTDPNSCFSNSRRKHRPLLPASPRRQLAAAHPRRAGGSLMRIHLAGRSSPRRPLDAAASAPCRAPAGPRPPVQRVRVLRAPRAGCPAAAPRAGRAPLLLPVQATPQLPRARRGLAAAPRAGRPAAATNARRRNRAEWRLAWRQELAGAGRSSPAHRGIGTCSAFSRVRWNLPPLN